MSERAHGVVVCEYSEDGYVWVAWLPMRNYVGARPELEIELATDLVVVSV